MLGGICISSVCVVVFLLRNASNVCGRKLNTPCLWRAITWRNGVDEVEAILLCEENN